MKNLLYITILIATLSSCQKGEVGPVGPMGDTGAAGAKGTDNNTQGPVGDLGPAGAKGTTGAAGAAGAAGANGTSNFVTTDWKSLSWKLGTAASGRIYLAEVEIPEITQSVLDKGIITIYTKTNASTDYYELNQAVEYTVGGNRIEIQGFKLGKVIFQHTETSTSGSADAKLNLLNNNTQKIKALIIKG